MVGRPVWAAVRKSQSNQGEWVDLRTISFIKAETELNIEEVARHADGINSQSPVVRIAQFRLEEVDG